MKKAVKIILLVILILVLAAAALCFWQRDNLAALKLSLSTSRDDLALMLTDNLQKVDEAVKKVDGIVVRDLTDEEKDALRNNEISRDELLLRLTDGLPVPGSGAGPEPAASPSPEGEAGAEQPPAAETADPNAEKLSQLLAEIYLMKAEYTAWLEDKYDEAIAEYTALDESARTTAAKYNIGMRYMSEALEKETECDERMAELEDEIRALLKEMGQDTSLVDDIKAAYEEEKALKKAYYLGLHN